MLHCSTRINVGPRCDRMVRASVRLATVADLNLLVRHRRSMFESIATFPGRDLDAADTVYRRWARTRLRTGHLAGFIVELAGVPVASGCAWIMDVQPHPGRPGTDVVYLLSMFTEPGHRGEGPCDADRPRRDAVGEGPRHFVDGPTRLGVRRIDLSATRFRTDAGDATLPCSGASSEPAFLQENGASRKAFLKARCTHASLHIRP